MKRERRLQAGASHRRRNAADVKSVKSAVSAGSTPGLSKHAERPLNALERPKLPGFKGIPALDQESGKREGASHER